MSVAFYFALLSLTFRMLYTELLRLWDESVQAVDARDWEKALAKLEQISEPTSRTLFNAASAHVALEQFDDALKVGVIHIGLDLKTISDLITVAFVTASIVPGTSSNVPYILYILLKVKGY